MTASGTRTYLLPGGGHPHMRRRELTRPQLAGPGRFPVRATRAQDRLNLVPTGARHHDPRREGDVSDDGRFAEFERAMIAERVRTGLARPRGEGKRLGRPPNAFALEKRIREALATPGSPVSASLPNSLELIPARCSGSAALSRRTRLRCEAVQTVAAGGSIQKDSALPQGPAGAFGASDKPAAQPVRGGALELRRRARCSPARPRGVPLLLRSR